MRRILFYVFGVASLLAACTTVSAHRELVVFAASSLTDAMTDLAAGFEAAHPDVRIIQNYAGSSQLALQIIEGAPADVFASANPAQMENVTAAGLAMGEPVIFATNQLTVITPVDNPAGIQTLEDLGQPGILLVLAAPGVPIRTYTDQVVTSLAEAYGPGYVNGFYGNLVSEEDNVRQVVAKVMLGEADAGVVYTSEITSAEALSQVPIPAGHNVSAEYPIVALARSEVPALAQRFIDYVRSEEGQRILAAWGFGP